MAPDVTLLSIPQASERFRVSASTVRRWVKAGRLQAVVMPSGRAKIRKADVEAILAGDQAEAGAR